MVRPSLILLLLVVLEAGTGSPFSICLKELSDIWFPAGTVIRVPTERCREIQVRAAKSAFPLGVPGRLDLMIDGAYRSNSRSASTEEILLTLLMRDGSGFLVRPEHIVTVATGLASAPEAQWTILRWERQYIEANTIGARGSPVTVRLDQPPSGLAVASHLSVHLAGEILPMTGTKLTIDGREVLPQPDMPGYHFDLKVPVNAGSREIVVVARDGQGDSTTLVLPVQSDGGNGDARYP